MALESLVEDRNRRLSQEGWIEVGLGLLFTSGTFLLALALGFLFGLGLIPWGWLFWFTMGFATLFLGVATWSAWRKVEPLAALAPPSDGEVFRSRLEECFAWGAGGAGGLALGLRRRSIAGLAEVFVAGPRSVFNGWRRLRMRLPSDPTILETAERLLPLCREPRSFEDLPREPAALLLLAELGLIRQGGKGGELRIVQTEKGRKALGRG